MRLLIVEDDYITMEGIIKVMPWQELGITQIEKADDGINALETAKRFKPEIVLSDIRMPRMDGIEFTTRLREIEPECKIIIMSAYSDREYYKFAIKLKAVSFIEKPIDLDELKSAVKNAVALCREDIKRQEHLCEISRLLQSSLPFIQSEVVLLLINRDADLSKIKMKLKQVSLDIPENADFVTIVIKITGVGNEENSHNKDIQSKVLSIIDALISHNNQKGITAFKDNHHIIIHLYSQSDRKFLFSMTNLEGFYSNVYETLTVDYHVSIAVGKVVRGISNIFESYKTAVLALQKAFFYNGYPFIKYTADSSQPYLFGNKLTETFSDCLSKRDKHNLILTVKQFTCNLRNHPNTPINTVKDFYFQLLMQLLKSAESEGIQLTDREKSGDYLWEIVTKFFFLSDLENYLTLKIETYFRLLGEKNRYGPTVLSILNYIHTHYHEQTLSTIDISGAIGLSSAYICVLFKEETGKTINCYITKFRIEKSIELLKDKSLRVADIAKKVGYLEGDYFAKLFRKIEGLSPSEYRKRFLK